MTVHSGPVRNVLMQTMFEKMFQVALIVTEGMAGIAFFADEVLIKIVQLLLQGWQGNRCAFDFLMAFVDSVFRFDKTQHRFADQVAHLIEVYRSHAGMKAGVFETAYGQQAEAFFRR